MIIQDPRGLEADGRVHHSSDGALTSLRCLDRSDGLGLTVTLTRTHRDLEQDLTFTGHRETSLLVEGTGRVETCQNGKVFDLSPGTLWSVGPQQPHRLAITAGARVLNVFNPAHKSCDADAGTPAFLVRDVSAKDGGSETGPIKHPDGLGFTLDWLCCEAGEDVVLAADHGWVGCLVASGAVDATGQAIGNDTALVIEPGERTVLRAATRVDLIQFGPG